MFQDVQKQEGWPDVRGRTTRKKENVFLIRVWLETGDGDESSRSYVTHYQSGEKRYFSSYEELRCFLEERATSG